MTSVPHINHRYDRGSSISSKLMRLQTINPDQRKLRHIKSIHINNISIDEQLLKEQPIPESKTDDCISNVTSTEIEASRLNKLKSRSTVNLKHQSNNQNINGHGSLSGDLIRTSHLPMPNINNSSNKASVIGAGLNYQIERQLKLQELNSLNFFDSFYTINDFLSIDKPFFISRVFNNSVSLDDEISLNNINKNSLTINLYVKLLGNWKLLIQFNLKLSFLINIGDDLNLININFKNQNNFLILQLVDDCYYILPDSNNISIDLIQFLQVQHLNKSINGTITNGSHYNSNFNNEQLTCSYDQIMKLNNLTICIIDLLKIKKNLSNEIRQNLDISNTIKFIKQLKVNLIHLKDLVEQARLNNLILSKKLSSLNTLKSNKLKNSKLMLINGTGGFETSTKQSQNDRLSEYLINLELVMNELNKEKSKIAANILKIFPIEPILSDSNSMNSVSSSSSSNILTNYSQRCEFKILNYNFPNKLRIHKLTKSQIGVINCVLGYLTLILIKLSSYLNVPLRYNLKFLGSNSYIIDPISKNQTKIKVYPLFINAQNIGLINRFEIGLNLMIKNLKQLFKMEGIVELDDFNILGNFKILLTCIEGFSGVSGSGNVGGGDVIDEVNELLINRDRINSIKKYLMKS